MKTIIQSEAAAECGLACLAMVAGFHGAHLGMPEMRRRFAREMENGRCHV
jgi:ATP-binding cassette subfamily B protein RaxB